MKNLKAPFLVFALLLLNTPIVSAYNNPPPPSKTMARLANDNSTNDGDPDEGDPDAGGTGSGGVGGPPSQGGGSLPIDQNIMILLIGGLALGATVIYRKQTKKASN